MRLPFWIKEALHRSRALSAKTGSAGHMTKLHRLHTVCEEAQCPNQPYCYAKPTAAFLILGDICTRNCRFCAVEHGIPSMLDPDEPMRIAVAAEAMELRYVVITSVTRDDLSDGGAHQFSATIKAIRQRLPHTRIEVLIPDFQGNESALQSVLAAAPDVLNHNIETVPRLYAEVRPEADYSRSIHLLSCAKKIAPHIKTKSGLMVGLGERLDEVIEVFHDLRYAGCDALTIGQYLMPTKKHLPVVEYIHPDMFIELEQRAKKLGFCAVASGPLVRSSMNAEELFLNSNEQEIRKNR
jgi:lipoic acid synthetase